MINELSVLLKDYFDKVRAADRANEAKDKAKEAIEKEMGETEAVVVGGFRITYKPNRDIDPDAIKEKSPAVYRACKAPGKFSVTIFRKKYAPLVPIFERDSKKRILRIDPV